MITFNIKVPKKRGRPKGSKNKPWHRAGRPRIPVSFFDRISKGAEKFLESPFN